MENILLKLRNNHKKLINTSIDEIIDILSDLGNYFKQTKIKQELLSKLPDISGFSKKMCEAGIDVLCELLSKESLENRINKELGNKYILDDFQLSNIKNLKKRATPLGIILHIAPSNVFLGIADSIIMAIITKNSSIVKLSNKDTFFPHFLKKALENIDKKHILSDNLELIYLPHNDKRLDYLCQNCNGILFWGGLNAMNFYKKKSGDFTRLILNGPRYSIMLVEESILNTNDYELIAKDSVLWEQAACSSPQVIYIIGNLERFANKLSKALKEILKKYPPGKINIDEKIEILKEREYGRIKAIENNEKPLFSYENPDFSLIKLYDDKLRISPNHRTIFLKKINGIKHFYDIIEPFSDYLQTLGIKLSAKKEAKFYNILPLTGFYRSVPLGKMTTGIEGAPHDGRYILQDLINWQTIELDSYKRLNEILLYAKNNSKYYKKIIPESLKIEDIPLLTREIMIKNSPPKSNNILTQKCKKGFYFCSGGTTGNPKYSFYTNEDFRESTNILTTIFKEAGLDSKDIVANIFIAGNLWTSFLVVNQALMNLGCINLPISGNSRIKDIVNYIIKFEATVIVGLPSLIISIAEYIIENNIKHNIKKIFYGGEHFTETAKEFLIKKLNINILKSAGYAVVDAGPIGLQCKYLSGSLHHPIDEYNFVEIVDNNGKNLSYNQIGEIVVTNLSKKLMPIIRFKTGDLGKWINKKCKCGRERVFELLGRCDDMLVIAGINLLFNDVSRALSKIKGISNIFQLVVETDKHREKLTIVIETKEKLKKDKLLKNITEILKKEADNIYFSIKQGLLNFDINLVNPGTIRRNPRTGKIRKIIDLRH